VVVVFKGAGTVVVVTAAVVVGAWTVVVVVDGTVVVDATVVLLWGRVCEVVAATEAERTSKPARLTRSPVGATSFSTVVDEVVVPAIS
jgi:hypothetical protein